MGIPGRLEARSPVLDDRGRCFSGGPPGDACARGYNFNQREGLNDADKADGIKHLADVLSDAQMSVRDIEERISLNAPDLAGQRRHLLPAHPAQEPGDGVGGIRQFRLSFTKPIS
jgi:hypothetical protein